MREQERLLIEAPYDPNNERPHDDRFASAMSLDVQHVLALRNEVISDQDPAQGVRWWTTLALKPRVIIGDHLVDCIDSIETNLVEARLHHWELLESWEKQDALVGTGTVTEAPPHYRHPRPMAPIAELPAKMIALHTAGLARSLGSVLDCLAAAMIAVTGLPQSMFRASFLPLVTFLDPATTKGQRFGNAPATPGEIVQARFRDAFMTDLAAAGPTDWYKWLLNLRNMMVHRGRRLGLSILYLRPGPLGADGERRPVAAERQVLPSAPELSQVEAWARWGGFLGGTTQTHYLSENADVTLRGAMGSVARIASRTCEELLTTWRDRRAAPTVVPQPEEQWPKIPHNDPCAFVGYAPGTVDGKIDAMIGGPNLNRRMLVAALDTGSNHLWR